MNFDFDLFVLGGGSGGVRAARVAASELGAKVGIAEGSRYGGTCVIRGCIPKKLMFFASEARTNIEEAKGYCWSTGSARFSWNKFQKKLSAELDRLEHVYLNLLTDSGVKTFNHFGRIVGPQKIELSNGQSFTARYILIATGGLPQIPTIEGLEHTITSNEIFQLEELPISILIIGGGYIACELAGILNGLGVKTTQYYRGERILKGFDNEASELISSAMIENGIDLKLNLNITKIEKTPEGLCVTDSVGRSRIFECVLFATGRKANTSRLIDPKLNLTLGESGEILVDSYSQTKIPSIFAIGDVTNRVNLTPVAIHEAMAFVDTVFRNIPRKVDHEMIPTAIFCQPEFGTVGLSEVDARELGPIEIYATNTRAMRQQFAEIHEKSLLKLVVCAKTRKILGCHIVAKQAGELIQLMGTVLKLGATKEELDATMAVHPTLAEELVTMGKPR